MPDVAYPLDPDLGNLPASYSPVPNNDNDVPATIFKVLKAKFPTQIKHVGILWANATPATAEAEKAFERAATVRGLQDRLRLELHRQPDDLPGQRPHHEVRRRADVLHPAVARLLRGHGGRGDAAAELRPHQRRGRRLLGQPDQGRRRRGQRHVHRDRVRPLPGGGRRPAGREAVHQVDEHRRPRRPTSSCSRSSAGRPPSSSSRACRRRATRPPGPGSRRRWTRSPASTPAGCSPRRIRPRTFPGHVSCSPRSATARS